MPIDVSELEIHRASITGHCYRMLGSAVDAEDAAQETIVRAWRNLDRFEGRSSLRSWLHRIATNVCLDTLAEKRRRYRPIESGSPADLDRLLASTDPQFEMRERTHWLEPIADDRAIAAESDPHEAAVLRQSIRLAFVAALQQLPPRQRAALLLAETLGWSSAEIAETLGMSVAATNSALQRARATVATRDMLATPLPLSPEQSRTIDRYVDLFLRYDVDALVGLLREDATMSMPPFALWLRGRESVRRWLRGPGAECEGSRLVPIAANGSPAFAQYRRGAEAGTHRAWGVIVLELAGEEIVGWNSFLDVETLFPMFGLPLELRA